MKYLKLSFGVLFAALLVFSITQNAVAAIESPQLNCENNEGIWEGVGGSSIEGTCTYPPEHINSQEGCENGESFVAHYDSTGNYTGYTCAIVDSGSPETGAPVVEPYSHNSGQSSDEPVHLCTQAAGPWRCSYFTEGTCAVNCYIDPHLPTGPQNALPSNVISTLYVNISPDPGGSYSVCFENLDNESLTIYQYLGGAWVAVAISTNNPICASSSGDGSFYLGS